MLSKFMFVKDTKKTTTTFIKNRSQTLEREFLATHEKKNLNKKPTTPGIPKRSPILVLTGPDAALLRCSDENRFIQRGMVVGERGYFYWHLLQT